MIKREHCTLWGEDPEPGHVLVKPAKLDADKTDQLSSGIRALAPHVEFGFHRVQYKICQLLAPLGKLWSQLEIRTC